MPILNNNRLIDRGCDMATSPNNQGDRRAPAAAGVRFVAEYNGSHPFAPPCGLGKSISQPAFVLHRTSVPFGNLLPKALSSLASGGMPTAFGS